LLGDVTLLLNLADGPLGTDAPDQIKKIRKTCTYALPPCIARAPRGHFASRADCVEACEFALCKYPEVGLTLRSEFGESFCRRIAAQPGLAPWQDGRARDHQNVWRDMEGRARTARA
jgi:hypothetical protein